MPQYRPEFWERVVVNQPARVVELFHLMWTHTSATRNTSFGDGKENFKPVILAVQNISRSVDNTQWQRLVEAGIAEEILECIFRGAEIRTFSELAKDLLDSGHVDYSSSFLVLQRLLLIGCMANPHFEGFSAEKRFLEALGPRWSRFMQSTWSEPSDSQVWKNSVDKALVMQLIVNNRDPHGPIASAIQAPNDPTVSIIIKYMMLTEDSDAFVGSIYALESIIDPCDDDTYDEQPFRLSRPDRLFERMRAGLQGGSFHEFFRIYSKYLITLEPDTFGRGIRLLYCLSKCAEWEHSPSDGEFIQTLLGSEALLSLLLSMLKSPKMDSPPWEPHMGDIVQATMMLLNSCLDHLKFCMDHLGSRTEALSHSFLVTLVRMNFLDVVEHLLATKGQALEEVPVYVSPVIGVFCDAVRLTPSALAIIRHHLPRPRLLRACLDMAFASSLTLRRRVRRQGANTVGFVRGAWMFLDLLCYQAQTHRECMRRGCRRRRTARCKACGTTEYCSEECQTDDWPEHRLVCGLKGMSFDQNADASRGWLPERLPFRFGPVTSWSAQAARV